jgi:hypothetical protein
VPAIVQGVALANRAAVVAERKGVALQLAENRMEEVVLYRTWTGAAARGEFGSEWPGYRWELSRGSWTMDDMTWLTLRVFFEVQGREHEVRLDTLVDGTAP